MSDDRIKLTLSPSDYAQLFDLLDARIRSERARISAYRSRHDTSNEMQALGTHRRLIQLRESLVDGVEERRSDA